MGCSSCETFAMKEILTRRIIVPKGFCKKINSFKNKRGVSLVPAAAVIPTPQVMVRFIGFKMFVADYISFL